MSASALATAKRLLNKFGRHDGEISRPRSGESADSSTPWKPSDIPAADETVASGLDVVVLDADTVRQQGGFAGSTTTLTPEADAAAYLAGDIEEPKLGDYLETDGEKWYVLKVSKLKPATINILYTLELRG